MAFIINKQGQRVNVNIDVDYFSNDCVLYSDGAELQEFYLLNLYKGKIPGLDQNQEPELIKQIEFKEKPSKDQIMYEMWKNNLSRYDIATIETGYRLDWKD